MGDLVESLNLLGGVWAQFMLRQAWQVLVVFLVVGAVTFALRHGSAVLRYSLWLLVIIRFLLPPDFAFFTGAGYWLPRLGVRTEPELAVSAPVNVPLREESPVRFEIARRLASPEPLVTPPSLAGEQRMPDRLPVRVPPSALPRLTPRAILMLVWATAVLCVVTMLVRRSRMASRILRDGKTVSDEEVLALAEECKGAVRLRRRVRLLSSAHVPMPVAIGIVRPSVVVPDRLLTELSPDQFRAVLLHEFLHVKRLDPLVSFIQRAVQAVYVYHPAIWLANTMIDMERERVCDDQVLALMQREAETYGETLVRAVELAPREVRASGGLVSIAESKRQLKDRLRRIAQLDRKLVYKLSVASVLAMVSIAAVVLPLGQIASREAHETGEESPAPKTALLPDRSTAAKGPVKGMQKSGGNEKTQEKTAQQSERGFSGAKLSIPRQNIPVGVAPGVREQIERLYSRDKEEQIAAARTVGNMGEIALPAIPFLEALLGDSTGLGDKPPTPFKEAVRALTRLGRPPIERLAVVVADESRKEWDRWGAVQLLGQTHDPRAVEPLSRALKNESTLVRSEAAYQLGEIGDDRAIGPLIGTFDDEQSHVRCRAARALAQIGYESPHVVEPLLKVLRNAQGRVRSSAALALSWLKGALAKGYALKFAEPSVRDEVKLVVHGITQSELSTPLLPMLKDEAPSVRADVAGALGCEGDHGAVEPLIAALQDPYREVRTAAAWALGGIGDARAVGPLTAALEDKEENVRSAAASAFGMIGDPRAVRPLIDALGDEASGVRCSAVSALGHLKDSRAVEPLIDMLDDKDANVAERAVRALVEISESRAVKPLIGRLGKGSLDSQACVTSALIEIGEPVIEQLIAALGDKDFYVRWHAAFALREITGKDFGQDRRQWHRWWKNNRDTFERQTRTAPIAS